MMEAEVMEAEVVDTATPYAAPVQPMPQADDLFGPSGAYGDAPASGPLLRPLPPRSAPPPARSREPRGERRAKRPTRPLGILLLALLHFLGAGVILATVFFLRAILGPSRGSPIAMAFCIFFASLFVAAGVGMLKGVKWVWWLEAFGLALSICGSAISVVLALMVPLFSGSVNPLIGALSAVLIFKYLARLVFGSLLLAYLFKENVLAFFGLKRADTGQALGILFGLAITLTLLLTGILFFLLRARFAPGPSPRAAPAPFDPAPMNPAPLNNEPPASGSGITIWDAKQRAGGVFSVECRVDGGAPSPAGVYFWIISGPAGKVEFPIPGTAWAKQRQQLSGRAQAADGSQLNGPLTCYIEEQVGATRRRISNEAAVER